MSWPFSEHWKAWPCAGRITMRCSRRAGDGQVDARSQLNAVLGRCITEISFTCS